MKVKESLYEKFKEESDPIHDMKIGIKNIDNYVEKRLSAEGLKVDNVDEDKDFWTYVYDFIMDKYHEDELVEIILDMLEHTPLKYQLKFIEEYVDNYIEEYSKQI
jgi:hypothetical protein